MLNFTSDSILPIFNFLTQEEVFTLRLTCKTFNIAATSNEIIMPFLNRLKAIDKTVSTLPPEDVMSTTWCYERFIKEFNRLANSQAQEITDFLNVNAKSENDEIKNKISSFKDLGAHNADNHHIQLRVLEQRHAFLEDLNTALIQSMIDLNSTKLFLHDLNITRIPENLFTDPEYEDYWKKVQEIDCNNTSLQSLPQSLGHCQALKVLNCSVNKLKYLPESLGNCQALERIFCNCNQLEVLPESLGNCKALQEVHCYKNKIKSLPESLGKCQALLVLNCDHNQLKALPESLAHCQMLYGLFCSHNQLKTLPESLGQCQALRILICMDNQLKALPESLANCQQLVLRCDDNNLTDIPNIIKTRFSTDWTMGEQNTHQDLINLAPTATKVADNNKPTKDQSNPDSNDKSIPIPAKRIWRIKVAAILISITLSCFIFALSGGALIAALLLKAGVVLPTTKATFAAISIASGLAATTTLWGLCHLGAALKTAIIQHRQSPEQRFRADNNACDAQLAQLAAKFSTSTIQLFVQPLKAIQTQVAAPQLIQFKQFEIESCKKVLGLKDTQRSQAKEIALIEARNFLDLHNK
ncbi:MAG: hypothetical protein JSS07_00805 [Proteobacteria bacterium]|nr:hypothetical protein [Pseudomonadota bacterium]